VEENMDYYDSTKALLNACFDFGVKRFIFTSTYETTLEKDYALVTE